MPGRSRADFGAPPILLLDEVAAHLDAGRRAALYDEICALGAQAFMTGTGAELFAELGDRAQHFEVRETDGVSAVGTAIELAGAWDRGTVTKQMGNIAMIDMNRVNFITLCVADLGRARAYYEKLGWALDQEMDDRRVLPDEGPGLRPVHAGGACQGDRARRLRS